MEALSRWLEALDVDACTPVQIAGDASLRKYYRTQTRVGPRVVADAPPPENCRPFVDISDAWRARGVHVPQVHASELDQGFMLLEDFGDQTVLDVLGSADPESLYRACLAELEKIQALPPVTASGPLAPYDETRFRFEMSLFRDWFLQLLDIPVEGDTKTLFEDMENLLVANAEAQPKVTTHRDFHSRNLMWLDHRPGVLDFQDALHGPVTYDPVSLLRDCYIAWPDSLVETLSQAHRVRLEQLGILSAPVSPDQWRRWFDLMGMERHLKAIGIFARLWVRDRRPGYLGDIPRTLGYVRLVSDRYPDLHPFRDWLDAHIIPRMESGWPESVL